MAATLLLILVSIASAGSCRSAGEPHDGNGSNTRRELGDSEPLIRVTNPPSRPPQVSIVARRSSSLERQDGTLFRSNWLKDGEIESFMIKPVPWPEGAFRDRGETWLEISTGIRPRNVVIQAFPAPFGNKNRPSESAIAIEDCWLNELSGPEGCRLKRSPEGMRLDLSILPRGQFHVTVYASWREGRTTGIETVDATWLFTIRSD
jgi:hypothetical protein